MQNRTKAEKIKTAVWLVLGLAMLVYYIISGIFAGFRISMLGIWALGGVVCLVAAALTARYGRLPLPGWLFRAGCVLLAFVAALSLVIEVGVVSGMGAKGEDGLDYIVVLGAHLRGDRPSNALLWRIDAAEDYLRKNPDTRAILSGGQGADEEISEAQCMYNVLTERGIDGGRLILEDQSRDTNENIRNSLALMEEDATFAVVTNNFHVFRAVMLAETQSGRDVSGIASPYKNTLVIHYMIREIPGMISEVYEGNIQ